MHSETVKSSPRQTNDLGFVLTLRIDSVNSRRRHVFPQKARYPQEYRSLKIRRTSCFYGNLFALILGSAYFSPTDVLLDWSRHRILDMKTRENTMLSSYVGFPAGLLTTAANIPEVSKTYRSRSGEGLSFRNVGNTRKRSRAVDRLWRNESFDARHRSKRGGPCSCIGVNRNEVDFRSHTHTGVDHARHRDD